MPRGKSRASALCGRLNRGDRPHRAGFARGARGAAGVGPTERRDPTEVTLSVLANADPPTVDDHVGRYRQFAEAEMQTVILCVPELTGAARIAAFAPVIDAFRT